MLVLQERNLERMNLLEVVAVALGSGGLATAGTKILTVKSEKKRMDVETAKIGAETDDAIVRAARETVQMIHTEMDRLSTELVVLRESLRQETQRCNTLAVRLETIESENALLHDKIETLEKKTK